MTMINLAPLMDQVVLPIVATAATAAVPIMGGWIVYWARKFFKVKIDGQTAEMVDTVLYRANTLAQHQLGVVVDQNTTLDVKNAVVANALAYAQPKLISEMQTLNIDPATLGDRLMARLPVAPNPSLLAASGIALGAMSSGVTVAQPIAAAVPAAPEPIAAQPGAPIGETT